MSSPVSSPRATLPDALRRITVENDETATLRRIVGVALQEVPGTQYSGILLFTADSIVTRAASDPLVELVDQAQFAAKEGPCLSASVADVPVVHSGILGTDPRWPTFGRAATELGVNSAISFKLFDGHRTIGALNMYARAANDIPPDAEETGSLLAAHAAVVVAAARAQVNLNLALQSRDVIGQAKGILMERYKLDEQQAFEVLIATSQHVHRKLRDVADELRTTGELPGFS